MKRIMPISAKLLLLLVVVWVIFAQACMTFRKSDQEMKQRFAAKGIPLQTITVQEGEQSLHYAQTGTDDLPTLLFIHGTPGSWDAFANYLEDSLLRTQFRMISIDRPGFGYSNFGKAVNLERQSAIMSPLIQRWKNGKPFYLVGHSLGGPMVIKLAADNPGLFQGIVVLAGSIDPAAEKPEKWRPWLFKTPLNLLVPGAFKPSNEELWYLKTDLVQLKSDFEKIRIPVYFVHGEKDTWVPPGNVAYGQSLLKNAPEVGILMLPEANHFIPWTRFQEIRNVLISMGKSPAPNHAGSSQ
jgi:pimeloyl-ACP methyl ester carboxylesterase